MVDATIDNTAAYVIFSAIVCLLYGLTLLGLLFLLLAVRGLWRWLTRHTWSDVIVSIERKALR